MDIQQGQNTYRSDAARQGEEQNCHPSQGPAKTVERDVYAPKRQAETHAETGFRFAENDQQEYLRKTSWEHQSPSKRNWREKKGHLKNYSGAKTEERQTSTCQLCSGENLPTP